MVSRDQRDDLDFLRIEAPQISILDQVIRMAMMAIVADVYANVMQQRGVFQPLALPVAQPVDAACLIENAERKARDLLRMFGPVAAAFSQFDDAAAANVGVALDLANARAIPVDVVEDEPFTQGQIAERQVFGAEPAQDRVEQHRSADAEIRSPRIHCGHVESLFDIHFHEPLPQPMDRLRADLLIPDVVRRCALLLGNRESAETENRSRGADHAIESGLCDLFQVRTHFFIEMFDQPALIV